ncbi:GumC family protein [Anditalea andensis]|uniref:Tyrosine protein kinase n=1 Tax=Anditalea andensis TaxID=1048983 RepID=A0A074KWW0_9BACT|nr:polysaccharide biosynthesis tyrosine autokinase [Anditalea andensis]KEO73449.1 tyrosine protein kinase [Anditalea andensis]
MNQQPNHSPYQVIEEEETLDLRKLLFKYLRYWPYILVSAIIGVAGAFVLTKYMTSVYKIEATVLISDDKPSLGADLFDGGNLFAPKNNIENEIGILKSFSLAEEAIGSLDINVSYYEDDLFKKRQVYGNIPVYVQVDWTHPQMVGGQWKIEVLDNKSFNLSLEKDDFALFNPQDPFYKTKLDQLNFQEGTYQFGQMIEGEHFKFQIDNTSSYHGETIFITLIDTPTLALSYKEKIDVTPFNKQASLLALSLETPLRRLGQDYLNKLMEVYLERELKIKNQASENTVRFIDQQLSGITDSLTFFENRLQKYRSENRIFNLSKEGTIIFERLEALERERGEAELRIKYYQTLQTYLSNEQLNDLVAPSVIGIQDPLLNSLVINLAELQSERVRLSANFSDQTPAVREVKSKIQSTRQALLENVNSALSNNENLMAQLNQRVRNVERDINALPETERNLLGIQRQFTINENIYVYLLQKRAESEITKASNIPNNTILDYARAGNIPVAPKRTLNLLVGFILGFVIPIVIIVGRNFLKVKVEDPEELEHTLKVPLISMIGRSSYSDKKVVLTKPRSMVTESFRNLRADMAYLLPNHKGSLTLSFTSAISGEGKTFTAFNTASVYSLIGKKTIILGLDLRKPRIADDFGLTNDVGMSTVLSSATDWRTVVKPSGFPYCDILLAGPTPPNPAELLMQPKFAQVMKEIQQEYDVVIMDCPPVGLVSETKELFQYADINLFVFRQNYSHKNAVQVINDLKTKGGIKKLYAVFNDVYIVNSYGDYGNYGYGYGYGNGKSYGYHEEEEKKPWYKSLLSKAKD